MVVQVSKECIGCPEIFAPGRRVNVSATRIKALTDSTNISCSLSRRALCAALKIPATILIASWGGREGGAVSAKRSGLRQSRPKYIMDFQNRDSLVIWSPKERAALRPICPPTYRIAESACIPVFATNTVSTRQLRIATTSRIVAFRKPLGNPNKKEQYSATSTAIVKRWSSCTVGCAAISVVIVVEYLP